MVAFFHLLTQALVVAERLNHLPLKLKNGPLSFQHLCTSNLVRWSLAALVTWPHLGSNQRVQCARRDVRHDHLS